MNSLEISSTTSRNIFELLGYTVIESSISHHDELDMDIVHIRLDKQLTPAILEELTLAAQTLVRSITTQRLGLSLDTSISVSLDINGYLMQLISALKAKAKLYAGRAMTFGVPVRMEPLPAFHRKIIHTFLQNTPGIHTESFGLGPARHIVITVKED